MIYYTEEELKKIYLINEETIKKINNFMYENELFIIVNYYQDKKNIKIFVEDYLNKKIEKRKFNIDLITFDFIKENFKNVILIKN